MIETECLWNRNISQKKPVLKHGSYAAFTKHGSITDRAVLEHLSLNSTSGSSAQLALTSLGGLRVPGSTDGPGG